MRFLVTAVVLFLAVWYVGGYDDKCKESGPEKNKTREDSTGNQAPAVSSCFHPHQINQSWFCQYRNIYHKGTEKDATDAAKEAFAKEETPLVKQIRNLTQDFKQHLLNFNGGCNYTTKTFPGFNEFVKRRDAYKDDKKYAIGDHYSSAQKKCPKALDENEPPKIEEFKLNIETILKKCTEDCNFFNGNPNSTTDQIISRCSGEAPDDPFKNYTILNSPLNEWLDLSAWSQTDIDNLFRSRMLAVKVNIRMVGNTDVKYLPFQNLLEWDEKAALQLHNNLYLEEIIIKWQLWRKNTKLDIFGNPRLNEKTIKGIQDNVETMSHRPEQGDCDVKGIIFDTDKEIMNHLRFCKYVRGDLIIRNQKLPKSYPTTERRVLDFKSFKKNSSTMQLFYPEPTFTTETYEQFFNITEVEGCIRLIDVKVDMAQSNVGYISRGAGSLVSNEKSTKVMQIAALQNLVEHGLKGEAMCADGQRSEIQNLMTINGGSLKLDSHEQGRLVRYFKKLYVDEKNGAECFASLGNIYTNTSDCSFIDGDVEFTSYNTINEAYMNNIITIKGKVSVENQKYSFFQFPRLRTIDALSVPRSGKCVNIVNNQHLAYYPFPRLKTLSCSAKYAFYMSESQVNYTAKNQALTESLAHGKEVFYEYTCRTGDTGRVPKNFCSKIDGKVLVHFNENKCESKDTYRLVQEIYGTLTFENCPNFTTPKDLFPKLQMVITSGFYPALTIKNVKKIEKQDFEKFKDYKPTAIPTFIPTKGPKLYIANRLAKKLIVVDTVEPLNYWMVAEMQAFYGGTHIFEVKNIDMENKTGVCVFVDPAIVIPENCTTIEGDLILNEKTASVGKNVASITGCLIMDHTNLPDYSFLNNVIVMNHTGCIWKDLNKQYGLATRIKVHPTSCIPHRVSSKPFKDAKIEKWANNVFNRDPDACGECNGALGDNCRVVIGEVVLEGNDTSNQMYHQLRKATEFYGKLTIRNTNLTKVRLNRLEIFEGPAGSGEWIHVENNRYLEMVDLPNVKQQIGNRTKYVNNPTMETRTTTLTSRRTTPVKTTTTTKPHKVFDQDSKKSEKDEAKDEESGGLDNVDVLLIVTGVIAVVVILLVIAAFAFAFTMRVRQMRAEAEREDLLEEEGTSATAHSSESFACTSDWQIRLKDQ